MQFDKTQKRALVFVAGLLGLSWYMGNQYEKADMMRSEAQDAYDLERTLHNDQDEKKPDSDSSSGLKKGRYDYHESWVVFLRA